MASVTFKNAQRIYPGSTKPAVDDLNLEIADGEFMVLVGPSGCGKSTSLRMLAGLEEVTAGQIFIGDRDITHVPPKDRDIAMVFQNYALYPHMSVAENMAFSLKMAKVDKEERMARVQEAAKLLDLEEYLDRKPKALSGGQRQRVAMGRAIVRQPQVFCMDEPLSNLDAKLRVSTRTQIAALQQRLGITTVYVTHDQVEAMTMGDRVAVMKDGLLQQVDTPLALYDRPVNLFVAGFIGTPPMNFLPAQVEGDELVLPFCRVPMPAAVRERASGKDLLIVGIRPEHIKDADLGDVPGNAVRFQAPVDQAEWLGNEQYAYVPFAVEGAVKHKLDELDKELDGEGMRTQMVVNLDPRSRVREGDDANFVFDPDTMHVFDPESGDCLTRDDAKAAELAQQSEEDRQRALERARSRETQSA